MDKNAAGRASNVHQPIDRSRKQIRVLKFHPPADQGSNMDIIELSCDMKTIDLDSEPEYEALSYVWGSPKTKSFVNVNGIANALSVTPNLHSFLRQQVHSGRYDTWLWIDQLSIKQDDIQERNHQVAQMTEIYRGASRVLVWLGNGSSETDDAFDGLNDLVATKRELSPTDIKRQETIARLEYWTRLWIIQELSLSRDHLFICGSRTMTWKAMESHTWARKGNSKLVTKQQSVMGTRPNHGWDGYLHASQEAKCADVKDRIFGLLGLVKEGHRVQPDYSLSPEEICLRVIDMEVWEAYMFNTNRKIRFVHAARVVLGLELERRIDNTGPNSFPRLIGSLLRALDLQYSWTLRVAICKHIVDAAGEPMLDFFPPQQRSMVEQYIAQRRMKESAKFRKRRG